MVSALGNHLKEITMRVNGKITDRQVQGHTFIMLAQLTRENFLTFSSTAKVISSFPMEIHTMEIILKASLKAKVDMFGQMETSMMDNSRKARALVSEF